MDADVDVSMGNSHGRKNNYINPQQSLFRLKYVMKSWMKLINECNFIMKPLNHA